MLWRKPKATQMPRLSDHAIAVHRGCHEIYYGKLLDAIEQKAAELYLSFGPKWRLSGTTPQNLLLLAEALMGAKYAYTSPEADQATVKKWVANDLEDGWAQIWLSSILETLQNKGLYLGSDPTKVTIIDNKF